MNRSTPELPKTCGVDNCVDPAQPYLCARHGELVTWFLEGKSVLDTAVIRDVLAQDVEDAIRAEMIGLWVHHSNVDASKIGRIGGLVTAQRGSEYYRTIAGMRKTRSGGRPRKEPR